MIKSSLTSKVVLADSSNYTKGREGNKICKITPHHMAGVLTGQRCAELFQNPNRNASANYCIGNDGEIVCGVGEENRAWTSNSKTNDLQAITIEVSNCENGGQWKISNEAWNSLIELCVDICKRYNFKLNYDGTPNGSLTRHNMFSATACPGPYLQSKFQELADIVNLRLEEKPVTPKKINVKYQVYAGGKWWDDVVNFNNTDHNGYAGVYNKSISGFRGNTVGTLAEAGNLIYRVHTKGGKWLGEIVDRQKDRSGDDFAGILGKSIDGIAIKSTKGTAKYRVHIKGGNWLEWVTQYNINDSVNGMAGIYGKEIDAIQVTIE